MIYIGCVAVNTLQCGTVPRVTEPALQRLPELDEATPHAPVRPIDIGEESVGGL